MTEPSATDPFLLAEELALLTILADRVADEVNARRAAVTDWAPGTRAALTMPDPGDPSGTVKIGTVRADPLPGVARIADRDAWLTWVRRNSPHNVSERAAWRMAWALGGPSREAVEAALDAAAAVPASFTADRPAAFLTALEAAGFTLTEVVNGDATVEVMPSFETETLKMTREARSPVAPGGEIPDGVEYVAPQTEAKAVVTIGKDARTRREYVHLHRGRLAELAGTVVPTTITEES